ncbi:TonB-dependent receptor [Alloacidobacterium sp.]|uniref:TonB-dependent receptor n=1 Tax=Alloacidobacterium sp. TaxID=2951999 RepID=UPI002D4CB9F2|nr:TonB-dependent receptor [Alloacidobacterium sp.]HYK34872.1 TonB-dependent receptor [Alloacidobacterium sp.]
MKHQVLAAAIAAAVMLFFVTPPVHSQQATTSLRGVITDPSGDLVPGASITITRSATGQVLQTTSNASGEYQFQQLAPGTWTVKVSAAGFGDQSKIGTLLVSKPATIDFLMTVQSVSQTVNVSAETETLNTSDATLGNAVNNQTIQSLPMIDRNVPDLLSLQPGVLYLGHNVDTNSDSRTGAVNGVRSDQGNITMDGLDDNDQKNGYAFTGVLRETLDSVDEFRVTTGMANSDQGRAAGAQVNLLTKRGTDQFHGAAYEYNRNTFTAANDWFNKQAELASGLPNVPGKYIRNTYGFDVGGPILKQKLFFFGNYEGSHIRESQQVVQEVPTSSLQAGNLIYQSNGNNVTLTPAQIAVMDPNCSANGTCPWGPGNDPNILQLLQGYPVANGAALGDGLNLGSFTFSSPNPVNLNTTIARLDWAPTSRHQLFFRGNLQDDTTSDIVWFPGQPPSHTTRDNTKGLAAGDTWTITNNLVNDLRYGYIRQGFSKAGIDCGSYVQTLRTVSSPTAQSCSTTIHVPVQNIIDNVSWTHGNHTLSFGADWRGVTNYSQTNNNSYGFASLNIQWLSGGGSIAGTGSSLDPGAFGYPAVDSGDSTTYNEEIGLLTGLVPFTQGQFNFNVAKGGQSGNTIAEGVPIALNYHSNEFEYYIQDQWKLKPNVTFTVGIRQVFLQPPYETHGQQIQPTVDTHQWFVNRYTQALLGATDQPDLSFAPSGKVNGKPSYWNMSYKNIAPRAAFVIAPDSKTTVRFGGGMYFDHFGQGIVDTFAQYGSFGLQTQISNPAGQYSIDNSPRFTGLTSIPPLQGVNIPSVIQYPYTPPNNVNTGLAITWGVDSKIKTPYTIAADFSVQRELPHGFSAEADYVGTFGRHLLQQLDLAEPLDLADPKSGMDYFQAGKLLAQATYAGQTNVSPIAYWEDMFPYLATGGMSATQNIYQNVYQGNAAVGNDSYALAVLDAFCDPNEGGLGCGPYEDSNGNITTRYYQRQFSSLYAWSSIGVSDYHSLQLTLRRVTNVGLSFNFSYALAKSIDMGSDAERSSEFTTNSFSFITNSFNPKGLRAVSDFDVRHLLTGDFIYQLPFGQGKRFGSGANNAVNALIGGWSLSGITRLSSALPFSVLPPLSYATNYQQNTFAVVTGHISTHKHLVNGLPEVFADPDALNNGIATGNLLRFPYPGEEGSRNFFRGDGYFEQDTGVSKSWKTFREQSLHFSWEVFNVSNSARFDTSAISSLGGLNTQVTSGAGFGIYSSQLVQSRKQQFSLRYDF